MENNNTEEISQNNSLPEENEHEAQNDNSDSSSGQTTASHEPDDSHNGESSEIPAEVIEDAEHGIDYRSLTKPDLLKTLGELLLSDDFNNIRSRIIPIENAFRSIILHERQEKAVQQESNQPDLNFLPGEDELHFEDLLKKINKKRTLFIENQEKQRLQNLDAKHDILRQLKELIQNEENMSKAFHDFHELQARWRTTGPVPPQQVHDLWMTYKLYVEKFYDLIKINRDLQSLDQKKNLEIKLNLCEQAEQLILEPSINKALNKLQIIQDQWKETGPMPRAKRTETGERLKRAASQIFERRHQHIEQQRLQWAENKNLKEALCEKAEQIMLSGQPTHSEIQKTLKYVLELQQEWNKTGPVEKSENEALWKRFRAAIENFFIQKNNFYQQRQKQHQENLQIKTELCIHAEALMNSTDWKNTAAEIKHLSEHWKKTGPVDIKMSGKIWNRFSNACDRFFENRRAHFASLHAGQEENYNKKNELLQRIEDLALSADREENMQALKNVQMEWNSIGMVPMEKKEELHARYKKNIDALYDRLRMDVREKSNVHFKLKMDNLSGPAPDKIQYEKKMLINKIAHLNGEMTLWENNIGFFAKSKNADQIKQEFAEKINRAKAEISEMKKQLAMIKNM